MLQKIIGKTKRAIEDFNMIDEGDKIDNDKSENEATAATKTKSSKK